MIRRNGRSILLKDAFPLACGRCHNRNFCVFPVIETLLSPVTREALFVTRRIPGVMRKQPSVQRSYIIKARTSSVTRAPFVILVAALPAKDCVRQGAKKNCGAVGTAQKSLLLTATFCPSLSIRSILHLELTVLHGDDPFADNNLVALHFRLRCGPLLQRHYGKTDTAGFEPVFDVTLHGPGEDQ